MDMMSIWLMFKCLGGPFQRDVCIGVSDPSHAGQIWGGDALSQKL